MIIDPFGEILSEIKSFENEITTSKLIIEKIELSGGSRFKNSNRPELYKDIITTYHESDTTPVWMKEKTIKD